ncbi:MAG: XisI protein [Bacteroidota bacterium]
MDKLNKYQEIIQDIFEEYAKDVTPANMEQIENQLIMDKERNHYQLVRVGWEKGLFVHQLVFHLDIKNEKVWIQRNWTDMDIAEELMEKGVERKDIVIGFIPAHERIYTGYAA